MSTHIDLVPKCVRIVIVLLALANIAFGVSEYFSPSALFQNNATGIDLAGLAAKYAGYEFAAHNLAIGLALMIVALRGVPESLAIVTIIRALIEFQTIIIAIATGNLNGGIAVAVVIFALEAFVIVTMFGVTAKRDAASLTKF
jgi:hypothetical protein